MIDVVLQMVAFGGLTCAVAQFATVFVRWFCALVR